MMSDPNLQEQARSVSKQMEMMKVDTNFQEWAELFAKQMKHMASENLQRQAKLDAHMEEWPERLANRAFGVGSMAKPNSGVGRRGADLDETVLEKHGHLAAAP